MTESAGVERKSQQKPSKYDGILCSVEDADKLRLQYIDLNNDWHNPTITVEQQKEIQTEMRAVKKQLINKKVPVPKASECTYKQKDHVPSPIQHRNTSVLKPKSLYEKYQEMLTTKQITQDQFNHYTRNLKSPTVSGVVTPQQSTQISPETNNKIQQEKASEGVKTIPELQNVVSSPKQKIAEQGQNDKPDEFKITPEMEAEIAKIEAENAQPTQELTTQQPQPEQSSSKKKKSTKKK